jgi:hypothetical protein
MDYDVNTVTILVELIRVDKKTSEVVARKYAQCWLSGYPWPQRCVDDPGGEFVGIKFQTLLQDCHTRDVCTSAKIPNQKQFAKECTKQWEKS